MRGCSQKNGSGQKPELTVLGTEPLTNSFLWVDTNVSHTHRAQQGTNVLRAKK